MATKEAEERLSYIATLYANDDAENEQLKQQLMDAGISCSALNNQKSPFEKVYFNGEMLSNYEPCMDALQTCIDADGEDDDAWKTFEETFGKFMDFSWCSNWDGVRYDIVIYGCSGYTGYLTMEYIKRVALKRNPEKFTFAFAGRTASKVAALRDRQFIGTGYEDTKVLAANYDDPVTMIDLARSARCIYNVAGPYLLTPGEIMLDACCFAGTHYVDINGEIPWMVRTMDLHEKAKRSRAIIAPASAVAGGYPDILLQVTAKQIQERCGEELIEARCCWGGGGTGAGTGGGTLATRNAMSSGGDEIRKLMADPFALGGFIPDRDRNGLKEIQIKAGTGEANLKIRKTDQDAYLSKFREDRINVGMLMPHTYSYFDTRVVRRTNALLADVKGTPYGRELNFTEYMFIPMEVAIQAQAAAAANPEDKSINAASAAIGGAAAEKEELERQGKYYKQGEGPALEDLGDAWLAFRIFAMSKSGQMAWNSMCGRDGYFETARVACETAMTAIFDHEKLNVQGGVVTCASLGIESLLPRFLNSGISYCPGKWHDPKDLFPPPYPE